MCVDRVPSAAAIAAVGKTFTVDIKGKNAKGEPFNNMLVLEKQ